MGAQAPIDHGEVVEELAAEVVAPFHGALARWPPLRMGQRAGEALADVGALAAVGLEGISPEELGAATGEAQVQVAIDIAQQISDFLLNGEIRHSVNIPTLTVKELEVLGPHLRLGEQLGRLAAQIIREAPNQVTVELGGEAAHLNTEPITASVLKGLLSGFLDETLNYVNAPFIARERGIQVVESRSREATDYIAEKGLQHCRSWSGPL